MDQATLTLIVLAVAAVFFATEVIPLAVTAMSAAIVLGLLGVLTPTQVFAGLSNPTVVLFAGMFIIGAAMFRTGLAQQIGIAVVKKSGTDERALMAALMLITIILSSVSSNTATVACLMPVVIQICRTAAPRRAAAHGARHRRERRRHDHDDRHTAEHPHERDAGDCASAPLWLL